MSSVLFSADIISQKLRNLTPKQKKAILIGAGVVGVAAAAVLVIPAHAAESKLLAVSIASDTTTGFVPFTPSISGIAEDKNNAPLPGVILNLFVDGKSVASQKTDKNGNYLFTPTFTKAGDYVIDVGAGQVLSKQITLHVQPQSADQGVASITINASELTGKAGDTVTFSGKALDQTGAGLAGVPLYLFIGNSNQGKTTSDSKGNYSFMATFPNPGNYDVDVSNLTTNQ